MYLLINDKQYTVSRRIKSDDTVRYLTVAPMPPDNITGTIQMFRDDGFLMSEDNSADYARHFYNGTLLTLTNQPEPQPAPPEPELTNAEKRKKAYSTGWVDGTDYTVTWNEERYTTDDLTQLGMRYQFRDEAETAAEIESIVADGVNAIRAAFPDEDAE